VVDRVSSIKRSQIMRAVQSRNTGPELLVRSAAHRLGLRFRIHDKQLPGTPDLVLRGRNTVVFVNGCYWHRHENCLKAGVPKSNRKFWLAKFESNRKRDKRNYAQLRKLGWRVIVVWQCEARTLERAIRFVAKKFHIPEPLRSLNPRLPRKRDTRGLRSERSSGPALRRSGSDRFVYRSIRLRNRIRTHHRKS